VTLRRLWKLLSGATLLVSGLLIGDPPPVAASTGGCAGDVDVALDAAVWARPGHDTYEFTLSEPLAPGVWSVQAGSSDAYVGRSETFQAQEQWVLDIAGHTTLGPTTDLADGVEAASVVDDLGTVVSVDGIERFTVRHVGVSTPNGTDSVTAECVSFTLLESPGDGLSATPTVRCGAGEVEIQLDNDGSLDADYVATIGSQVTSGTLVPGAQVTVSADITGAVTAATVSGARGTILDVSLDTTCPGPPPPTTTTTQPPPPTTTQPPPPTTTQPPSTQPPTTQPPSTPPPVTPLTPPVPVPALIRTSVLVDCAADEVLVLLGNAGDVGATVDVALPLSEVRSGIALDAGTITTSTLAIGDLNDGVTEVRVSDSVTGATYTRETIELACDDPPRPTATTVLDCVSSVLVVHLANQAGDPAQLTVVHERVEILAELELAAGEVAEVEIPLGDAASVPVRVIDADGNDVLRIDVANVCPRPDTPDLGAGDAAPGGDPAGAAGAGTVGPSVVQAGCAAVDIGSGDQFDVRVELDGTVLVAGTVTGDLRIPVVPGEPIRIVVSDPGSVVPGQVITPGGRPCAEVRVTLAPSCGSSSAEVSIRRDGVGRERFVILVDGKVAGVLAIDGSGTGTVPVPLGFGNVTLTVSRSMATTPIVVGTISCGGGGGAAAPLAASLVAIVLIASAAGVVPWPSKVRLD
jgi:hypothetical protein